MNESVLFLLLVLGFLCSIISIILHIFNKPKTAILILIISFGFFGCYAIHLYPFLNVWDERFHALVSKNLMTHPLMPTLYNDPVITMAYERWDRYIIWLHKQPLFMWQIALSFKLFGVNETSLRIPGLILLLILIFVTYRSGILLYNTNSGYYSAFLVATSPYLLKLVSGRIELDQNDVSFICYVSFSIWAWLEYLHSKKKIWLVLIGVFSGYAILCKWLTGLFVYLIWGVYNLIEYKIAIKKHIPLFISLLITCVVFLPWQILTFKWYPTEAKYALELNSKHFTEAVDGHTGDFWYHFVKTPDIYGIILSLLIIPSLIIFYQRIQNKSISLAFITGVAFVFLFFSLAVTKMPSFTALLILPIYLSFGIFVDFIVQKTKHSINKDYVSIILIFVFTFILFYRMDLRTLVSSNSFYADESDKGYKKALIHNKNIFLNLKTTGNSVIFNVKGRHYVEAMFYTGIPAYNFIPSPEQYQEVISKNKQLLIFQNEDSIPSYLTNKENVIIKKDTIYLCE